MSLPALALCALLLAEPVLVVEGDVRVRVEPVPLPWDDAALPAELARAAAEKAAEDALAYAPVLRRRGATSLRALAEAEGYYGSPAHRAWAAAAAARTGGRVPASWWMEVDPFGGTAGNGPRVLPLGRWPAPLARVALAHDTDWTLGRHFGVGPLAALRDQPYDPRRMGVVGLRPFLAGPYARAPLYLRPRAAGWQVRRARSKQ